MPEPANYQPEWVTKLDVARRQLQAAVRMFFERRDPVVTHGVVAAAHQILTDVGAKSGVNGFLKGRQNSPARIRELNHAANFFKHADRDPAEQINIEPLHALTAEFLMDAVWMLQTLSGALPVEGKIFFTWFVTKHRELFEDAGPAIRHLIDTGIDPDDYRTLVDLLTFHDVMPPDLDWASVATPEPVPAQPSALTQFVGLWQPRSHHDPYGTVLVQIEPEPAIVWEKRGAVPVRVECAQGGIVLLAANPPTRWKRLDWEAEVGVETSTVQWIVLMLGDKWLLQVAVYTDKQKRPDIDNFRSVEDLDRGASERFPYYR